MKLADNCYIVEREDYIQNKIVFEYVKGNRNPVGNPKSLKHIHNIEKAMLRHRYIPSIIVGIYNNVKYIIDGQHRFEAAKLIWEAGKEYDLHVEEHISINPFLEAVEYNNTKLAWGIITYLEGWALNNQPNYNEFLTWVRSKNWNRNIIPYRIGLALLGVKAQKKLQEGVFQLGISFKDGDKIFTIIKDTEAFNVIISQEASAKAFYNLFKNDFDLIKEFLNKFNASSIPPHSSRLKDWTEYYQSFIN